MKFLSHAKTAVLVLIAVLLCDALFCGFAVWPRWQRRSDVAAQLAAAEQQLHVTASPTAPAENAAAVLERCVGESQVALLDLHEAAAARCRLEVMGDLPRLTAFVACAADGLDADGLSLQEIADHYTLAMESALPASEAQDILARLRPVAPSPLPLPSATPSAGARLLAELDTAWQSADWPAVIRLAEQLRLLHPDTAAMTEKLYAAHVNHGHQLLGEGRLEEAKRAFTAALAVRPAGGEATDGLRWLSETALRPAVERR